MNTSDSTGWERFYTDPHPGVPDDVRISEACSRCGGDGLYHGETTMLDDQGRARCFSCNGSGSRQVPVATRRARARAEAKRWAERENQNIFLTALADESRAWAASVLDREERLSELQSDLPERSQLRRRADSLRAALSDTQQGRPIDIQGRATWTIDADNVLAEYDELVASRRPVPVGRVRIEGVVRKVDRRLTRHGLDTKVLLEGEGWRAWGTIPQAVANSVSNGSIIAVLANVEASADDASFGLFGRATNPELLGNL